MHSRWLLLLIGSAFTLLLPFANMVWAGAPHSDPSTREDHLAHICQGGDNNEDECDPTMANQCPNGQCVINFVGQSFSAEVTLSQDDVINQGGAPTAGTLAVLLKVKNNGQTYLLSEISPVLFNSVESQSIITTANTFSDLHDLFLFFPLEGIFANQYQTDGVIAEGLRQLLGATGVPVVVGIKKKFTKTDHSGDDDPLASVLSLKITLRFVSQLIP
jgi:hypothetical protein